MCEQMQAFYDARDLIESADSPAAEASGWDLARQAATDRLAELGVRVITDVDELDADIPPLKYGWQSTPLEVIEWCQAWGAPFEVRKIGAGVGVSMQFDSKPDDETRAALKAAGCRYEGSKTWQHKAFGQWPKVYNKREVAA